VGAFARLGGTRRQAIWQAEALGRSGALFERAPSLAAGSDGDDEVNDKDEQAPVALSTTSPLPEMTLYEETIAEFRGTSMTTGPHPISFVRAELERRQVTPAAALPMFSDGSRARIGGMVVVRQRPGTAKGLVFVTLEDETGFTNAVVFPDRYETWRKVILGHPALVIEGVVQNREGVVTLLAERFEPLSGSPVDGDLSRNFH
jgi:error-prone DNA polymerase